jgi:VWFA-related protein
MKRRCALKQLMWASAGSLLPARLFGTSDAAEEPNYKIHSEARLVLLDVSVRDSRGALVPGLVKENFQVTEDGRLQSITVFDNADVPVTVGLLVDESRSMTPKRADVLIAAETFVQSSNPRDEMFVLNFNDVVRRGLPEAKLFSDDPVELRQAVQRGRPEGKTALNDAIVEGLHQLDLGRRDKKTLVVISDGGDNASGHTRADVLERVEKSIATIYTIGLYDEDDPDRNPGLLRHLAAISGGEAYFPADPRGVIPVCEKIAKQIRSRYTIGYVPKPDLGSGLRRVHVRAFAAHHRALHARTRTAYWY